MEPTNIFKLIDKIDTPLHIKNLLIEFARNFDLQESLVWKREVIQTDSDYHCNILLARGRVDLSLTSDENEHELSSAELICLFNYYYFPILFESSYFIFRKIWDSNFEHYFTNDNCLVFIDLGCSTLPSSLAFAETFNHFKCKDSIWKNREYKDDYSINSYIFFDESRVGLGYTNDFVNNHSGSELYVENESSVFFNHTSEPVYRTHYCPCTDIFIDGVVHKYNDGSFKINIPFIETFEKYILKSFELRNHMDKFFPCQRYISKFSEFISIIFNLTELRFTSFFDVENLIEKVNQILQEYPSANLAIVYQSDAEISDENWDLFKSKIHLKSILRDEFRLIIDESLKVKYEILLTTRFSSLKDKN